MTATVPPGRQPPQPRARARARSTGQSMCERCKVRPVRRMRTRAWCPVCKARGERLRGNIAAGRLA